VKNRAINSFHPNGKVKLSCVLDENGKPVGSVTSWDDSGKLIQEISAQNCDVVFVKKRPSVEDLEAKIKSLEERVVELELRLRISPKMEPEEIRSKFTEWMTLIDPISLQRVFSHFNDESLAGAMLDIPVELKKRMLNCVSRTRRKEILEMIDILKGFSNKITVEIDETGNAAFRQVAVEIVDYSLPYKLRMLERISSLERMGEIVLSRAGEYEIFV
jgi:hypothetical protein